MKTSQGGLLQLSRRKVIITSLVVSFLVANTLIVLAKFQLLYPVRSTFVPPYTESRALPFAGKKIDSIRGIPKIIHHSWKNENVPEIFKKWQKRWLEFHPTWEYHLWTDDDNRELVKQHFPHFLSIYDSFPAGVMRADSVRVMYMYLYGGVYSDLDLDPLKTTDELLNNLNLSGDKPTVILGYMGTDYAFGHNVPNAWMISTPGHPFWLFCISKMIQLNTAGYNGAEALTGPVMIYRALQEYNEVQRRITGIEVPGPEGGTTKLFDVLILPPGMIYPVDWHAPVPEICTSITKGRDDSGCKELFPDAYAITHWTHSWG